MMEVSEDGATVIDHERAFKCDLEVGLEGAQLTSWRKDLAGELWKTEFLRRLLECSKEELEEVKRFVRVAWGFAIDPGNDIELCGGRVWRI